MLNKELEFTLNLAFKEAKEKRHEFMTVEHLLLSLLDNPSAEHVLHACEVNIDILRQDLENYINETTPVLPFEEPERDTQPTLGFQRVLQRAVFHVQSAGKNEVTGANVLAAIFSEQDSQAVYFLRRENIGEESGLNQGTLAPQISAPTTRPSLLRRVYYPRKLLSLFQNSVKANFPNEGSLAQTSRWLKKNETAVVLKIRPRFKTFMRKIGSVLLRR